MIELAKALYRLGTESAFSVLAEAKKLEAQGKPMIHLAMEWVKRYCIKPLSLIEE